jgi:uncharacterized protein RhaS with RHS repeats
VSNEQLVYLRNRFYSPQLQRFVSEDPIGLGGGINTYSYVDGDPISKVDPIGEAGFFGNINQGISPMEAMALSVTQQGSTGNPLNLPGDIGVSATIPTGTIRVGGIPVPTVISIKYKRQGAGGSCTIGWGVGTGTNASVRYSDTVSQNGGDAQGWGLTSNYAFPLLGPVGASGSYTNYFNGAYSGSAGPTTVGGSPSVSYTLGYTIKW